MMVLHLNLLSPDKKKNFVSTMGFLFAREVAEFIIFTLVILAVIFLYSRWIIVQNMYTGQENDSSTIKDVSPLNKSVRDFNELTGNVVRAGVGFNMITPKFLEFSAALPPGIKLSGINFDVKENNFAISGTAAKRENLESFIAMLRAVTWLTNVKVPNSLLAMQTTDINFDIRASLFFPPQK